MNNDIKVSVIVITYNHEQFIKQALDSILMQKVDFKYEILIGDDASTDRTPEILKEYKKLYPDIIDLHLNLVNLGAARNAHNLLIKAKGEYIATCEGDDYWTEENKLKIQVDFLNKHKEFVGCCHKFKIVDEYSNEYKKWIRWIKYKKIFTWKDFDGLYLPSQPSTFIRRNIFLYNRKDYSFIYKTNKMIADRTLMLYFLNYGNFYLLNNCMSNYRVCLTKKKSDNLTSILYDKEKDYLANEYNYILNLERLGKSFDVNFNLKKRLNFLLYDYLILNLFYKYKSEFLSNEAKNEKIYIFFIYFMPYLIYRAKVFFFEKILAR